MIVILVAFAFHHKEFFSTSEVTAFTFVERESFSPDIFRSLILVLRSAGH